MTGLSVPPPAARDTIKAGEYAVPPRAVGVAPRFRKRSAFRTKAASEQTDTREQKVQRLGACRFLFPLFSFSSFPCPLCLRVLCAEFCRESALRLRNRGATPDGPGWVE